MSSERRRRRRRRLLAEDPHCYWCGCYLVDQGEPGAEQATIDHLADRNRPGRVRPLEGRWVIACRPCNEGRARERERALGLKELRLRSQLHRANRDTPGG